MAFFKNFVKQKYYVYIILMVVLLICDGAIISNAQTKKYSKEVLVEEVIVESKEKENPLVNSMQLEFTVEPKNEESESEEIVKEDGKVTFKGVTVEVPEVVVAKVNDSEDKKNVAGDSSTSNAAQISIEETLELYENSGNSVGIDVSKWQGNINWNQVKNSGVEFAMIRIGYRGSSQGSIVMDPYFVQNVKGATANGIKVGLYFFSMAIDEAEAIQEAAWTVENAKKYRITYPIVYDFESWGSGRVAGVSDEQIQKNALAFLGFIRSSGYSAMMYGSKNALNTRFSMGNFSNYKVWLAHYTEKTNYAGRYNMWQYTDKGTVPGISGPVDMNIAYFSYSKEKEALKPEPVVEEKKNNEEKPKEESNKNEDLTKNENNKPENNEQENNKTENIVETDKKVENTIQKEITENNKIEVEDENEAISQKDEKLEKDIKENVNVESESQNNIKTNELIENENNLVEPEIKEEIQEEKDLAN